MKTEIPMEQILEWCDSPVTKLLKSLALKEVEELQEVGRATDIFQPFEPQRTQEILAGRNAAIDTWEDVVEALEGRGLFDELSEDEGEPE